MKKRLFAIVLAFLILSCGMIASAHPGKTDASGGHRDRSTGEYHYHHGYPAHDHNGGACPYEFDDQTDHSSSGSTSSSSDSSSSSSSGSTSNSSSSSSSDGYYNSSTSSTKKVSNWEKLSLWDKIVHSFGYLFITFACILGSSWIVGPIIGFLLNLILDENDFVFNIILCVTILLVGLVVSIFIIYNMDFSV